MEKTLYFNVEVQTISGESNKIPDALSRMGLTEAKAPEVDRTFFSNWKINRLKAVLKKISTCRNIPRYL